MAAQHYVGCDNCEDNPASFLCKTCPGHLCEECKSEHENKKITKNHEITQYTEDNAVLVDILLCPKHKLKKLECYCDWCKMPVCTECIVLSHNGHAVKTLTRAYKEIRDEYMMVQKEIETKLLPKHQEILNRERNKKSLLSKRIDDIEKQIVDHTNKVLLMVSETSEKVRRNLRFEGEKGLQEIEKNQGKIEQKIIKLEKISQSISVHVRAKPGIPFFAPVDQNLLQEFKTFPMEVDYHLDSFQPGKIFQKIQGKFGAFPTLKKTLQGDTSQTQEVC